ncbi:MAG: PAS domain-containing sensor histidine kinase [Deltaproteobacteria bacterium]|nr:PAS domain-containing sensor histidine kinase [Deltaproteobacteria bacterium]
MHKTWIWGVILLAATALLWWAALASPAAGLLTREAGAQGDSRSLWGAALATLLLWGGGALLWRRARQDQARLASLQQQNQALSHHLALAEAAREALAERESFLQSVFDAIPNGIAVVDGAQTVTRVNRWLENRFAPWRPLEGKSWPAILAARAGAAPDGLPTAAAEVASQEVAQTPEGWLEVSSIPHHDRYGALQGAIAYVADITERKHSQKELGEKATELAATNQELTRMQTILQVSRDKLKGVFDALGDPILSVAAGGKLESLNMAAAKLAGRHPRELVVLTVGQYLDLAHLPANTRKACLETLDTARRLDQRQWRLVESPGPQGEVFHELVATPAGGGDPNHLLTILHISDVTAFKRMEATIRRYSESLEEMVAQRTAALENANRELLKLDQMRQDLTNMVVHDMKSPLAELMGNLDLLTYSLESPADREILDMAIMGSDDLLRMIMNLLDIGRLEENRLQVNLEELSWPELAAELQGKFRTLTRLMGLEVRLVDHLARSFAADRGLIFRVLQNLFSNALEHTPTGGVVTLDAAPGEEGGVVLSVTDTGRGIPEHAHHLIFEKFTQADSSQGPRTSTGLGLSFCRLAVEAHGGRIWFHSREGEGAVFRVWLPDLSIDRAAFP